MGRGRCRGGPFHQHATAAKDKTETPTGDIFSLEIPQGRFWFGQVISLEVGPMPGASILIYIYDYSEEGPVPDTSRMCLDRLLIPPCFINRMAWTRGYFLNVARRELAESDLPKQHCFLDHTHDPPRPVDLHGHPVVEPTEPVGYFALHSYASLDDELSDALGIPRAEVVE